MKKINNMHRVLKTIIFKRSISRADLSRELLLNKATVSYLTSNLEDKKIICQEEELQATKGRHSITYTLNKDYGTFVFFNIKAEVLESYITNLKGELLEKDTKEILLNSKEILVQSIQEKLAYFLKKYTDNLGVGLSIHGTIEKNEKIHFTPHNNISNFDLKSELEKQFKNISFYIENEANITALGENYFFDEENTLTITNSRGIGAGIISNYKIYKGSNGFAGELGHNIVVPDGLPCACGNKGCLEQYASEDNILKQASILKDKKINSKDFINLFNEKDLDIQKLYYKSLDYLSIAIINASFLLNPSYVILNGDLYTNIKETKSYLKSKFSNKLQGDTQILISKDIEKAFCIGFASYVTRIIFIDSTDWLEE
ncbi:MAG: ROK family protein [Lachnospirales bacterium]